MLISITVDESCGSFLQLLCNVLVSKDTCLYLTVKVDYIWLRASCLRDMRGSLPRILRYRYHRINVRGKVGLARLSDDAHAVASGFKLGRYRRIDDIRATAGCRLKGGWLRFRSPGRRPGFRRWCRRWGSGHAGGASCPCFMFNILFSFCKFFTCLLICSRSTTLWKEYTGKNRWKI